MEVRVGLLPTRLDQASTEGGGGLVAVPTGTLWERDPHTAVKHHVLARYLDAWFPIMLQSGRFRSVTFFEGFAGPGEYVGGHEGSPIFAMRSLLARNELVSLGKPVRFVFVEQDDRRADHLRELVARKFGDLPAHVTCRVHTGSCESDAIGVLSAAGAWSQPVFANLDPFDAHVPLPLVQRLAANRSSEVFVTFMSDRLRRFASLDHLPQGDAMFGSKAWRVVKDMPDALAKETFLLEAYRGTLVEAGLNMVAGFKLLDEHSRGFWLLYATSHVTGLQRMKAAMWDADPIRGSRFRDPRDPGQGQFDFTHTWRPDFEPLRRQIVEYLRGVGRVTLDNVREFVLFETSYREPHATAVVDELVSAGSVGRQPERGRLSGKTEVWLVADTPTLFSA